MRKLPSINICPKQKKEDFGEVAPFADALEYAFSWVGRAFWDCFLYEVTPTEEEPRACTVCFARECKEVGLVGFPVEAVYNSIHGAYAWESRCDEDLSRHKMEAFNQGYLTAEKALAEMASGGHEIVFYEGDFPVEFREGMAAFLEGYGKPSQ